MTDFLWKNGAPNALHQQTYFTMNFIFLISALVLLTTTVLPLSRKQRWWVRVLDFPRLQLLVAALFIFTANILLLQGTYQVVVGAIALICAVYHAHWIIPYTRLATPEVVDHGSEKSADSISIITANVLMSNRNTEDFLKLVQQNQPDILLTLETNKWWEEQLSDLEKDYPYVIRCPKENLYGMHLYSKLKIRSSEIKYLVEDDIPSIHTEIELRSGTVVRAHLLHPSPPVPEYSSSSSPRDAELVMVAKSLQDCDDPIIVTGDLNDVAWSTTTRLFRAISGLLDPRIGRGMFNTFHADYWFMRWPLDHLFHSSHFVLQDIRRLEYFGSDHFALFTQLLFCKKNNENGEAPESDQIDETLATEKMQRHNVNTNEVPFD